MIQQIERTSSANFLLCTTSLFCLFVCLAGLIPTGIIIHCDIKTGQLGGNNQKLIEKAVTLIIYQDPLWSHAGRYSEHAGSAKNVPANEPRGQSHLATDRVFLELQNLYGTVPFRRLYSKVRISHVTYPCQVGLIHLVKLTLNDGHAQCPARERRREDTSKTKQNKSNGGTHV